MWCEKINIKSKIIMIEQLDNFLELRQIYCEHNVSLKKKTWIHRGGKVKYFIVPSNFL